MPDPQASARGGNLPAELTSFVGRRRELGEVKQLLASSRLVTLTGVGGAGKTRLALRAAGSSSRDYSDGAWFVDLSEVEDPALLAESITAALGLHDRRAGASQEALADYLIDKKVLLLLDNCDHLRDDCAVLAGALLRRAAGLRILTTSRQTLGVTGEHVFRVPPLSVPDDAAETQPDAVAHYEALNLFVERAQAVSQGFALTGSTTGAAIAICQRLDGIPLAIELAAARLGAMSVQDLLDRLEDRYRVLVSGSPSALPRHRTLRELIRWSWDLCTAEEQTVWARASVFPSSFDLAAAEAICAGEPLDRNGILDVVVALVDKSIVTVLQDAGQVRYRMLETLRQFGQEQLHAEGEQVEVRERHRAYFTDLASKAGNDWFSERQTALECSHARDGDVCLPLRTAGGPRDGSAPDRLGLADARSTRRFRHHGLGDAGQRDGRNVRG
jgi:non-specific serine/threonine protein kinase